MSEEVLRSATVGPVEGFEGESRGIVARAEAATGEEGAAALDALNWTEHPELSMGAHEWWMDYLIVKNYPLMPASWDGYRRMEERDYA